MKMRVKFFYFYVILTIKIGFSQNEKITNYIYEGNKNTQTEAFVEAEKSYRKHFHCHLKNQKLFII